MRPIVIVAENLSPEGEEFSLEIPRAEVNGFLSSEGALETQAVAAVTCEARAYRSGRDVFVLGRVRGRVAYACVRCLATFEDDLSAEFHRVFSEEEEISPGEVELRREDLDVEPLEDGTIDLARLALEEVSLALRPHPVCRESCQGLCPGCGADRNVESCECDRTAADPRFAALEALSKEKSTKSE